MVYSHVVKVNVTSKQFQTTCQIFIIYFPFYFVATHYYLNKFSNNLDIMFQSTSHASLAITKNPCTLNICYCLKKIC